MNKRVKEGKRYENEYIFFLVIEIKINGLNIYKQYTHFRLTKESIIKY